MKRSTLSALTNVQTLSDECSTFSSNNGVKTLTDSDTCKSPVKKRSKPLIVKESDQTSKLPDALASTNVVDVIVEVVQRTETALRLLSKEVQTAKPIVIVLEGVWYTMNVCANDHLRIIAPFKCSNEELVANDEKGVVILESSELVSCTTISQAIYCKRKAVLNQRFRKNCQINEALILGSIVHSLFQAAVRRKPRFLTRSWLLGVYKRELLKSYFSQLIALNISCETMEEKLSPYIDSILKWVKNHMPDPIGFGLPLPDGSVINDVVDIEENLWDSLIGIKGKIDVSVQVKKPGHNEVFKEPLELKTGKSQVSIEHCGQVMLYCYSLAAKELDLADVGCGTLLYLLDGKTSRVRPKRHDLKGLLYLRNELATALCKISEHSFPSPLQCADSCGRCEQAITCFALQKLESQQGAENISFSDDLSAVILAHLLDEDLSYFKKWVRWIFLEWNAGISVKCDIKDIWKMSVEQRVKKGICMSNLRAVNIETSVQKSTVKFVSKSGSHLPVLFARRDMVVLSSNKRMAFAMGIIVSLSDESIEVMVDVDNKHLDFSLTFVLDRYESSSIYPINLGNLTFLMQNDKHAAKLRNLIISESEPKFAKLEKGNLLRVAPIIKKLNAEQALAVVKSLMAKDYVVIEGFPGSGKTSTIAVLVECLVILGRSVLLTSFTHSAVDNLIVKLLERIEPDKILRLGNGCRDELKNLTLDGKLEALHSANDKFEEAKKILKNTPVIACTCLEVASNFVFTFRHFSLAVIDEASQSLETVLFPPIFSADGFILVGDSNQLTPLVQSNQARNEGMSVSLLERLKKITQGTVTLRQQYRMNQILMNLSNKLFYDSRMICANDHVGKATLNISIKDISSATKRFLMKCVSGSLDDAVVFVDTQSDFYPEYRFQYDSLTGVCCNAGEMEIVKEICSSLAYVGILDRDIGVISMYRYHAERLRGLLPSSVDVSTVDQYQGREKSVIILTFAWTSISNGYDSGILTDFRRINVALTRAKHKLILVGCRNSLMKYSSVAAVINMIPERNIVTGNEGI